MSAQHLAAANEVTDLKEWIAGRKAELAGELAPPPGLEMTPEELAAIREVSRRLAPLSRFAPTHLYPPF